MRNEPETGAAAKPRPDAAERPARRAGLAAELPSAVLSAALVVGTAVMLRSCLVAGPIVEMGLG